MSLEVDVTEDVYIRDDGRVKLHREKNTEYIETALLEPVSRVTGGEY